VPGWREALTRGPHSGRPDRAEPLARPTRSVRARGDRTVIHPSASAPLSEASGTETPVSEGTEPVPAAGARALRLAGVWLAVLAVLVTTFLALVFAVFASIFKNAGATDLVGLAVILGLLGVCSLTPVVSWRAASPHRPIAGVIAFTIGAVALVVLLAPAVFLLLPPHGLYGLDVYKVWSAARLPSSLVVLVPAALMVFGSVSRWCVSGDAALVRRRRWIASGTTLGILASIGALVAVDAAQPACGPGRTCVAAAGISFVLPGGWSRTASESDNLYAATAGSDHRRFVVDDGARVIRDAGATVPTDIDGVAAQVSSLFEDGRWMFGSITGASTRRTVLPVGPAVRVSYTSTTSFMFTLSQTNVTEWFLINGRLVVLEYMRGYGEGTPDNPSSDPPDFTLLLESLRAL